MLRRRFGDLLGGGEMNVAVGKIDRRTPERALVLGGSPERSGTDFVDDRRHGAKPDMRRRKRRPSTFAAAAIASSEMAPRSRSASRCWSRAKNRAVIRASAPAWVGKRL